MLPASAGVCPVCGAAHAVCGQTTAVTPVDIPMRKEPGVSQVRKYRVIQNGFETVMKLNDEDAKVYPDAQLVDDQPTEQAEAADDDEAKPAAKGRTAPNKARRPAGDK